MKRISSSPRYRHIIAIVIMLPLFAFLGIGSGDSGGLPQPLPAFQVDPSGSANLAYALEIPPGTGGVVPSLSLVYNSRSGSGMAGMGWSLGGLDRITRDPSYGIRFGGTDRYLSTMDGPLVAVDAPGGIYHPKNESFTRYRISSSGCTGPCEWTARGRDGILTTFGGTPNARVARTSGEVGVWAASRVEDRSGNGYDIEYLHTAGGGFYPSVIRYNNREIRFDYDSKTDPSVGYLYGVKEAEDRLLSAVRILVAGVEVRRYDLIYGEGENGAAILNGVRRGGSNSGGTEKFTDLSFIYSRSAFQLQTRVTSSTLSYSFRYPAEHTFYCYMVDYACYCLQNPCGTFEGTDQYICDTHKDSTLYLSCKKGVSTTTDTHLPVDIDGDGRTDFAAFVNDPSGAGVESWYGSSISVTGSNIRLKAIRMSESGLEEIGSSGPIPLLFNSFYSVGDVDGDGRTDFVSGYGGKLVVRYSNGVGFNSPVTMSNVPVSFLSSSGEPDQFLIDMDGDGRSDFVRIVTGGFDLYHSNGSSFTYAGKIAATFTPGTFRNMIDLDGDGTPEYTRLDGTRLMVARFNETLTGVSENLDATGSIDIFADRKNRWFADVNGDGLRDFVRYSNGTVKAFVFNGVAFVAWGGGLNVETVAKDKGVLADVNGDGRDDYLYNNNSSTLIFYSGGTGLELAGSAEFPATRLDLAYDMNGDGRADLIAANPDTGALSASFQSANAHNNLLTSVSNGNGITLELFYKTLHSIPGVFDLAGRAYPILPNVSPSNVVTRSVAHQGKIRAQSGFVNDIQETAYEYLHPRYHAGTRETARGLGFEQMIERNLKTGAYSQTDFRQDIPYEGRARISSATNAAGRIVSRTTYEYDFVHPFPGTDLVRERGVVNEAFMDGSPLYTEGVALTYDGYGNVTRRVETNGETITTDTGYEYDLANWDTGRPISVIRKRGQDLIDRQEIAYINGRPDSVSVYDDNRRVWSTVHFTYDPYGNVATVTDPLGHIVRREHDPVIHAFVVKETDPLGHFIKNDYDTITGTIRNTTDFNGQLTEFTYDAYGRRIQTKAPGATDWSEKIIYSNTGDPQNQVTETRKRDGSDGDGYIWQRVYTDSAGRAYRSVKEGFTDANSGTSYTIEEVTHYDARGRVAKKSGPYVPKLETPSFTAYEYRGPDERLSAVRHPDGTSTTVQYDGLNTTAVDGAGRSHTAIKDSKGRLLEKRDPLGAVTRYAYDAAGRLNRVTDPGGAVVEMRYDSLGRKVWQRDPDTGATDYGYDLAGRMESKRDARNITIKYEYDAAGRMKRRVRPGWEGNVEYVYDDPSALNSKGRLSRVTDESGTSRFAYNERGLPTSVVRETDGLTFSFQYGYDPMSRPTTVTFPDGSVEGRLYSSSGYLQGVTLDGHPVVTYEGPLTGNRILRKTANGVETFIQFDPVTRRALGVTTALPDSTVVQNVGYSYDASGNIDAITDLINGSLSETFHYDELDRMIYAKGVYGEKNYRYDIGGNMTLKGDYSLVYGTQNSPHAVIKLETAEGSVNYQYDASGNLTRRNGALAATRNPKIPYGDKRIDRIFQYNTEGRLTEVQEVNGDPLQLYSYDHSGVRVKKEAVQSGYTRYYIGGVYEYVTGSGKTNRSTLYIKGAEGEVAAQWTRDGVDHTLASGVNRQAILALHSDPSGPGVPWSQFEANGGIGDGLSLLFAKNPTLGMFRTMVRSLSALIARNGAAVRGTAAALFLAALLGATLFFYRRHRGELFLARRSPLFFFTTPLLFVSLFTLFTGCGLLKDKGKGTPPWMVGGGLPPGIDANAPFVGDAPYDGNGPGDDLHGMPVRGMYFFHPDHLGSIVMVTNDAGVLITGTGPQSGLSQVVYKPYGEILRESSKGPDIFHFKYNGQEEDPETGMYYYKSRYYDPVLGRFTQADSVMNTANPHGMNPYMYVEGNPIKYNDPSGKNALIHMFNQIVGHMAGGAKIAAKVGDYRNFTAKNAVNTVKRITDGKRYNDSTNSIDVAGRKIGEAGNFFTNMFSNSRNFWGVIYGVLDYGVSALVGNHPYISYHNGGFLVHNSYFANHEWQIGGYTIGGDVSHVVGGVGHIERGESAGVVKHEVGHITQNYQNGGPFSYYGPVKTKEWSNDIQQGTFNYSISPYIMRRVLPENVYNALYMTNMYYDPVQTYLADKSSRNENILLVMVVESLQ